MQFEQSVDPTVFQENRLPARALFTKQSAVRALSLDGRWHFSYYDSPQEATSLFLKKKHIGEMQSIEVPSHFPLQGYGVAQYTNTVYPWDGLDAIRPPDIPKQNPTGCYAKLIQISSEEAKKDIILRFDGVDSALYLYVNGEYVGYKEDTFSPGEFLISPFLKVGENLISVMVLRYSTGSWLEDQDFWRMPGIFRSVKLLFCEKVRITDVFVRPTLKHEYTQGEVDFEVSTSQEGDYSYHITVDNQELTNKSNSKSKNTSKDTTTHITVNNPKLWSAEEPNLYYYTLELKKDNQTIDTITGHFGFRYVEIKGRTTYLNGKRLILRGVNRHEFDPYKGRVIDETLIEKDILLMKQNNINALRTSHYPNHPYVYELCDTLGIYMMDEVNLETHGTWMVAGRVEKQSYTIPDDKLEWRDAVLDRAISMTMRDKNHPSILFYSCGNESFGGSVIGEVATYFRSLNDNKLVHYEGIFHDRRYNNSSDVESQMYAKVEDIQEYLKTGDKPFLLCEYAHAMGNSVGNLDEYVALEDESEAYCGGFIWDFVDQCLIIDGKEKAGQGFSGPTDGYFCINGLVDGLRNPSAKLEQVAYSYSPISIEIKKENSKAKTKNIEQDKNIEKEKEEIIIRNKNLFTTTDQYDFFYDYTLDGIVVDTGMLDVAIGPLESKAYPIPTLKNKKENIRENEQEVGKREELENDRKSETKIEKENDGLLKNEMGEEPVGEYQLIVRVAQKADQPWAKKGHTIVSMGHGIESLKNKEEEIKTVTKKLIANDPLIAGDMHTGYRHGNFSFLIHHHFGQLVAIQHKMLNILQSPVKMEFWRAPTDNDIGVNPLLPYMTCKLASLYQVAENFRIEDDVYYTTIRCGTYQVEVSYRFVDNKVIIEIEPPKFDSNIPCFGISFSIDNSYQNVSYYGNEMKESYSDRKAGNVLRRVSFNPYKDQKSYLHPQEYGNRLGVRSLTLTDRKCKGMTITANRPFECSVLPYSCHELEEATYVHDLPNTEKLHVRILEGQSGVGGDDSWGAPVHEKYRYKGPKEKWVVEIEVFE